MIRLLLVLMLLSSCRPEWRPLFNGKDLTGWRVLNGKAVFMVEDGMIVGKTVSGEPNSFLATEEEFEDFILELEVKADSTNSGVQFRSQSLPDYMNGRVHGYQMEIDPSDRKWSGGIYEEAGRGWLYPLTLNPSVQDVYQQGEWNTYRIECRGDSIKTFINNVQIAAIADTMFRKGFIALQIHSIPSGEIPGKKVMWKNIRIKELP